MQPDGGPSLVIYLPDLHTGGVPRLYLNLVPFFVEAGFSVTLLLDRRAGALLESLPANVPVIELGVKRQLLAVPKLRAFLRQHKPALLLSAIEQMNVMAVVARALAGTDTRLIVSQHNPLSVQAQRGGLAWKALPVLYRLVVRHADMIVAVSRGVAQDLVATASLPSRRVEVIYNGVVGPDFADRRDAEASLEFVPDGRQAIINVGRLADQKDHATLLRAFAMLADPQLYLLLLGEGPSRVELEALARELGIAERVLMPGAVSNPLPAIKAARLFVLSSRYEGFPLVLIESLACGTPVVSTDCPFGPDEVLEGGKYGTLVPVGAPQALADAIAAALAAPVDPVDSIARGEHFSLERCASRYVNRFRELLVAGSVPSS